MKNKRIFRLIPLVLAIPALLRAESPQTVSGSVGAIEIPFEMPVEGTATVGIYNAQGRLIRPLAQVIPLPKGNHIIRWDGMDLWGRLVPAETDLEVRVFAGPVLRAKWEFGIASPNPVPWPTRPFGEGDSMRTGGWLGDHGVAASAVAVGDRIFLGSTMAEHGHTVIFCNLEGEKMWGRGGLEGWKGPRLLASDGRAVYGVVENSRVHRLELSGEKSAQIIDTKEDAISGLAAHSGKIYLTLKNHEAFGSVVSAGVGAKDFEFDRCIPLPSKQKVYNRSLNGQQQFATTFYDGGHPQTGIIPAAGPSGAGIVAAFNRPVGIGTLLVERMQVPVDAEFYVLKPGVRCGPENEPQPGEKPGADWLLFGKSDLSRRLSAVSGEDEVMTEGLYIRLLGKDGASPAKWPRFTMCRILSKAMRRVDEGMAVRLPAGAHPGGGPAPGAEAEDVSWAFRSDTPFSKSAPGLVMLELGHETTFDALVLLNCVNQSYAIDAWTGDAKPDPASDASWKEIAVYTAGTDRVEGALGASENSSDARISLAAPITTRALRLRMTEGMGSGRWGNPPGKADGLRSGAADVALLRLSRPRPPVPEMILQVRDGSTGDLISEIRDESANLQLLAFDSAGTLYSIRNGRLCRTTLPSGSGPVQSTPINGMEFLRPTCLGVSADGTRIAVGDSDAKAVFVFDSSGQQVAKIGGIGPRKSGPWNPLTVDQPQAVAIDKNGKIWVCEKTYTPKRVTRYSADGGFEKEFLGPPHYGGGGWLDPDLKSFWYEACQYEVDFARGTTRLVALNDVQGDPASPALEPNSYSYTKVGRPVYFNGHRYAVGDVGAQYSPGFVVCILDEGQNVWKPAAVLGNAQGSPLLTREDKPWRDHWLRQDLSGCSFIWCDLNDDGQFQTEEVQLFRNEEVMGGQKGRPFDGAYWGSLAGPDLTFWGSCARLAPSRFTAGGAPVFEKGKIQPFDYAKLAPVYTGNIRANQRAKTGFGGASMVARDGSLILEGQPYLVGPDLSIRGGPVLEQPSDLSPRILGRILDNPLSFLGSAETDSPVGEVAVLNGDNGQWFLWSVRHAVLLGEFFTGEKGGWGGITSPVRGMDVTGYKQDWETFFGHFTRARNGAYYVVAGRGHFGLSRLEGIDEIQVSKTPLRVSAAAFEANSALRSRIASAAAVGKSPKERPELKLPPLLRRTSGFQLDGDLSDWGDPKRFQKINGEVDAGVDAAWDENHLTIAYRGRGPTGNRGEDWRYIFKTGFAFDLMLRADPESMDSQPVPGDSRIVFGQHKGKWVAVSYEYVVPGATPDAGLDFTSPVASTRVDRVALLPDDAVRIAVAESGQDSGAGGAWTAEVQIDWKALGLVPAAGRKIRADFGILSPDSGSLQVDKRSYWSNPDTGHVADLAVEAQIQPANWGSLKLEEK